MKLKKVLATVLATASVFGTLGFSSCGSNKLVVYTEAGFAPFEYMANGKIVGVDVEIMEKVGEKLGKEVVFENVGFDTIIDAVQSGKQCKVGAAGISVNDERKAKVNFSQEYYTANLYVIYEVSEKSTFVSETTDEIEGVYWDSLAGKSIAVQNGTTADLFLGDELAKDGALYETDAEKVGFGALSSAVADIGLNSDVLIIDELPAKQLIAGNDKLACAPLYYKGSSGKKDEAAIDVYAIAVNKNEPEILAAINEVLNELGEDGIQALVNKHLGLE